MFGDNIDVALRHVCSQCACFEEREMDDDDDDDDGNDDAVGGGQSMRQCMQGVFDALIILACLHVEWWQCEHQCAFELCNTSLIALMCSAVPSNSICHLLSISTYNIPCVEYL